MIVSYVKILKYVIVTEANLQLTKIILIISTSSMKI
jgi:hypothetical protein